MAHRFPTVQLGMVLAVANLAAWGAWAALRQPYSPPACAALAAQRDEQDRADTRQSALIPAYTQSEHLLFSRPLRPLSSEGLPLQVLYVANAIPLAAAWAFVVPTQSIHLGPKCSESRTAGVLFLLLSSVQWALLGAAIGHWRQNR